jgi:hypothetical protein
MVMDEHLPVTAAVTPPALPDGFSVPGAVGLARDLVMNLYDRDFILKKHGITEAVCKRLEANEYFQKLTEQLAIEWNTPKSAQERLALHTAIGLEVVLPDAIARVSNRTEPLAGVAQMVKVLADIAGANQAAKQKQQGAPGEKFQITINLGAANGGTKEHYDKTITVLPTITADPEPDGGLLALQTEPEPA